ncbi:MliC family protein [uncultured Microbulbifer sp.]|uniref:MliC family protein n=1 Tax=uncultured Microbulbifer sp. TaxID=348147 RepID=UPI00260F17D8|nr:MliC family protein [uncultured Microbulbifer sp.]
MTVSSVKVILFMLLFTVAGCSESDDRTEELSSPDTADEASMPSETSLDTTTTSNTGTNTDTNTDTTPSYDCSQKLNSSIEELICTDGDLAVLDRKMAEVFKAASQTEKAQQDKYFKARQRGWIKGRNDCWKAADKRGCTADSYKLGIAALQARYGLVSGKGPVTYLCDGSEVTATYYETDPATAVARHKDEEELLYIEPSGSGARYSGPGVVIWEHQGEAKITWGQGRPEMQCKVRS